MKLPKNSLQKTTQTSILRNFVQKLFLILNDQKNRHTIQWTKNGEGFQFVNQEQFVNTTLKKYYRHSNLASFIRQLNMYGFRKVKEISGASYYVHPMFLKDKPQLVNQISRKAEKKLNTQINKQNQEKQEQHMNKQPIKPCRRRVRFFPPLIQPALKNQSLISLGNLIGKSQITIFNNQNFNLDLNINSKNTTKKIKHIDQLSINSFCEDNQLLSELAQKQQKQNREHNQYSKNKSRNLTSAKSRVIYWTPSDII